MFKPFAKISVLVTLISLATACGPSTLSVPTIASMVPSATKAQTVVPPKVTLSMPAPSLTSPLPTSTVLPASTFVPPSHNGNGLIAFDSDDGIYLMDVKTIFETGNDNRSLLIENAFGAAWSPDGTQIAFASTIDGEKWGIFIANADGSAVRQVTEPALGGISPNWSPDGTQIAFVADRGGNNDIYIINADGSNLQQLTHDSAMDGHPDFSPDGTRIAFTSDLGGNPDIYVLDLITGGDAVNLTQNPAVDAAPDWSPDGSRIAFYSNRNGRRECIFLMDDDGSNIVQLTNSLTDDWHPAWSPDGMQVAFVSYRNHVGGDADIYVINLSNGPESEGNQPIRLTRAPAHDENPAWQPSAQPPTALFQKSDQEFGDGSTFSIALGDIDNDADLDVLVANFESMNQVWVNQGGNQGGMLGKFLMTQNIGDSTGHGIALGDLDSDGDLDTFLVHNKYPDQVWLNDGTGNFTDSGQRLGAEEDWSTTVSLGDVDNDGDLDAITTQYQKPARLWLNDGSGAFALMDIDLGIDAVTAKLGDVDQDGDSDILITYNEHPTRIWFNDGSGDFIDSGQRLGSRQGYGHAEMGDVDNDGDLDALLASTGTGGTVWLNTGNAQGGKLGVFSDSGQILDTSQFITAGDIDSDNDLDILTCKKVWLNDGMGIFQEGSKDIQLSGCSRISLGDIDLDGDLDAFVASFQSRSGLWINLP